MNDLWIGREGDLLHLAGSGIQLPLTGCRYSAGAGTAEVIEDLLTLALESRIPADFFVIINRLERILGEARTYHVRRLGDPVWLGIQPLAGDDTWRALILDGWLESCGSGPEDLSRGRMQLRAPYHPSKLFRGQRAGTAAHQPQW